MRISEAQAKVLLGRFYIAPKAKQPRQSSKGEIELIRYLHAHKIAYEQEFKFCPHRKWRADFLILGTRILVEVEGGTWSGGRHTRGKGYEKDCEKYSWAAANGWTVLRFTTGQVSNGEAISTILSAINYEAVQKNINSGAKITKHEIRL